MTRFRDWQSRLHAYLGQRELMRHVWGANDCCIFVADAVLAMEGRDPAAGLRSHRSQDEAAALLRERGGIIAIADDRFACRIRLSMVGVGDVGLVDTPDGPALALWGGSQWLAPRKEGAGLARLPLDAASLAWRGECRV